MEELLREYSEKLGIMLVEFVRERFEQLLTPSRETKNVVKELNLLFKAARHKEWFRSSVLLTGLSILEQDRSVSDLREQLGFHEITVYKALLLLQTAGFVRKAGHARWTVDDAHCPILYYLTRGKIILAVGRVPAAPTRDRGSVDPSEI